MALRHAFTLAQQLASQHPGALFMDLERESDRACQLRRTDTLPGQRSEPRSGQLAATVAARRLSAEPLVGERRLVLGLALGGASHTTVARHLDLLVDALMVRRLAPHLPHLPPVGKRLVKSPRIYVRDSGLLHALLGIADAQALQGHPIAGASWEGFVIEQIAAALPASAVLGYYRTAAGAELDLVVQVQGRTLAFEIKLSSAPKPARGFWQALQDVKPERAFVVAPVQRGYDLEANVRVVGLAELEAQLALI